MIVPTVPHAGALDDLRTLPAYLAPDHGCAHPSTGRYSCAFCGVGDSGLVGAEAGPDGARNAGGPVAIATGRVRAVGPTPGCAKLQLSTLRQRPGFPIHVAPSVLDGNGRRTISYREAITRLADLVLAHLAPRGRTLLYACGQIDYFTIFAIQEVLRLLGVRNLTGNAEHCLNAGAVHNEILTGQEGPFVTIDLAVRGAGDRLYLLNGWNGQITHPPVFRELLQRGGLDAYLVEVQVTESADAVAQQLGPERVLLVRPRTDPLLAMAVIHEILTEHAGAIDHRFIDRFGDRESFERLRARAIRAEFAAEHVAPRITAEPSRVDHLITAIRRIAGAIARPGVAPVNIPSVGLSQTSGVVAHCLWGSAFALVGKYGLNADGTLAGGTLRLPGQINAQTEVQGLSRNFFMGRIPVDGHVDAARRMGLDDGDYLPVLEDHPRAALDYSEPSDRPELMLFVGTQFEANMMERRRWLAKLAEPNVRMVVIDPIPDPYTEAHAELIIPSPPHPAATKLYQNGEWRFSLGIPHKRAAAETRTDATILYDLMAEITHRVERDDVLQAAHPILGRHAASGLLRRRFCDPGLPRVGGEVSRHHLWQRIQAYMSGGSGPLYCRPEHPDGTPIGWHELLAGSVLSGGVGSTRFRLDYDRDDAQPFGDIYRCPTRFCFFTPTDEDLRVPAGVILNSGRSSLSDEPAAVRFATNTFNSGKATPLVGMPEEQPLVVSPSLADQHGLRSGDRARVISRETGAAIIVPIVVSDRVKGDTTYMSFHKSKAQVESGVYLNDVTSQRGRCPYSSQTTVKATSILIEPIVAPQRDTSRGAELPQWGGHRAPLYVTHVHHETHDVATVGFHSDPPCRYVFLPGQYISLILSIAGKRVVRSYSISSPPTRPDCLEITVKRVPGGLASNWLLDHLKPGDRIDASGPYGHFCLHPAQLPRKLLLLSAGSGVTPVMSMARWLCDTSADVDVLFLNSVSSSGDIIFGSELALMDARYPLFSSVITTTRRVTPTATTAGRISLAMLQEWVPDLHERHVFLCGPAGFMAAARTILTALRFDPAKLHIESFGHQPTSVASPVGDGVGLDVSFVRSGRDAHASRNATLLELAEAAEVDLDYACRVGSCGVCRARLLDGEVTMDECGVLSAQEQAEGYVLACVSRPRTRCIVDA